MAWKQQRFFNGTLLERSTQLFLPRIFSLFYLARPRLKKLDLSRNRSYRMENKLGVKPIGYQSPFSDL
jgi:hypothetical protein